MAQAKVDPVVAGLAKLVTDSLQPKEFSSGSRGFFVQDKVELNDDRYQSQVTVVLVGSSKNADLKVEAEVPETREAVADFCRTEVAPKVFSSGKTGFYGGGKTDIAGQTYQVMAQAVKIGS